jgi:hypothetical protein
VRLPLFLEPASPFSQIWRRNRVVCRLLRIPGSALFYALYSRRSVFPFNHWLLRKDKCEHCVSLAFSSRRSFFRNRRPFLRCIKLRRTQMVGAFSFTYLSPPLRAIKTIKVNCAMRNSYSFAAFQSGVKCNLSAQKRTLHMI